MDWQLEEYQRQMGELTTERQVKLARKEKGQCVCSPVSRRMPEAHGRKGPVRKVHERLCPKFRFWMADFLPPETPPEDQAA